MKIKKLKLGKKFPALLVFAFVRLAMFVVANPVGLVIAGVVVAGLILGGLTLEIVQMASPPEVPQTPIA